MSTIPEVLFVCVPNAGRSQMAAALLDDHAAGRVRVRSAGSTPADEINPAVVAVMADVGLDLSAEFPKPLTDHVVHAADVVITMGCGDACPIYPGKRYLDWDLPDPAGLPAERVRPIRDDIDRSQPVHRSHWGKTRAGTIMVPRTGRGRLRRKPDEIPRGPTPICHNVGYRQQNELRYM